MSGPGNRGGTALSREVRPVVSFRAAGGFFPAGAEARRVGGGGVNGWLKGGREPKHFQKAWDHSRRGREWLVAAESTLWRTVKRGRNEGFHVVYAHTFFLYGRDARNSMKDALGIRFFGGRLFKQPKVSAHEGRISWAERKRVVDTRPLNWPKKLRTESVT